MAGRLHVRQCTLLVVHALCLGLILLIFSVFTGQTLTSDMNALISDWKLEAKVLTDVSNGIRELACSLWSSSSYCTAQRSSKVLSLRQVQWFVVRSHKLISDHLVKKMQCLDLRKDFDLILIPLSSQLCCYYGFCWAANFEPQLYDTHSLLLSLQHRTWVSFIAFLSMPEVHFQFPRQR